VASTATRRPSPFTREPMCSSRVRRSSNNLAARRRRGASRRGARRSNDDTRHLGTHDRAIREGEKARLHAPPNPWVGALVVRDGVIIATGHTQVPGESHAEVEALRHAGELARGATRS